MTRADSLSRPEVHRRSDYRPASAQEEFIVPLLRARIEDALSRHPAPAGPDRNRRALDVGCGRQPFRGRIEDLGYSYLGADTQQNPESTVDVLCAIDEELPGDLIDRGPFGLILCTEVMEHVADWDAAFRNFARLLDGGGIVVATCPMFYPLHEEPYDFWRPTLHALDYFGHRAGLRSLERQGAGDAWDVLGTLLGSVRPAAVGPGLLARAGARAARAAWPYLLGLLRRRVLPRVIQLQGPVYLSNVVVFEKP